MSSNSSDGIISLAGAFEIKFDGVATSAKLEVDLAANPALVPDRKFQSDIDVVGITSCSLTPVVKTVGSVFAVIGGEKFVIEFPNPDPATPDNVCSITFNAKAIIRPLP